jgi:Na+-driven multidrug efflux pump
MRDLTRGPIARHLLTMAAPIAVGMAVQTMHYLVDLYFASRLGGVALAGVSRWGPVADYGMLSRSVVPTTVDRRIGA